MKYIFLILLFIPFSHARAATYWVDGSIQELTKSEINELDSYASPIPASFVEAKKNSKCFLQYETVRKRLIKFETEKSKGYSGGQRDKYISELDKKFIQPCLKKYRDKKTTTSSNSAELGELEERIAKLENQVKEIIEALRSMGKSIELKES